MALETQRTSSVSFELKDPQQNMEPSLGNEDVPLSPLGPSSPSGREGSRTPPGYVTSAPSSPDSGGYPAPSFRWGSTTNDKSRPSFHSKKNKVKSHSPSKRHRTISAEEPSTSGLSYSPDLHGETSHAPRAAPWGAKDKRSLPHGIWPPPRKEESPLRAVPPWAEANAQPPPPPSSIYATLSSKTLRASGDPVATSNVSVAGPSNAASKSQPSPQHFDRPLSSGSSVPNKDFIRTASPFRSTIPRREGPVKQEGEFPSSKTKKKEPPQFKNSSTSATTNDPASRLHPSNTSVPEEKLATAGVEKENCEPANPTSSKHQETTNGRPSIRSPPHVATTTTTVPTSSPIQVPGESTKSVAASELNHQASQEHTKLSLQNTTQNAHVERQSRQGHPKHIPEKMAVVTSSMDTKAIAGQEKVATCVNETAGKASPSTGVPTASTRVQTKTGQGPSDDPGMSDQEKKGAGTQRRTLNEADTKTTRDKSKPVQGHQQEPLQQKVCSTRSKENTNPENVKRTQHDQGPSSQDNIETIKDSLVRRHIRRYSSQDNIDTCNDNLVEKRGRRSLSQDNINITKGNILRQHDKGSSSQDNIATSKDHLARQHVKGSSIQDNVGTSKDHLARQHVQGSSIQDNLDTSKDHLARQHVKGSSIQDNVGTSKDHLARQHVKGSSIQDNVGTSKDHLARQHVQGSSIQDNLDTSKDHLARQHVQGSSIQDNLDTSKDHLARQHVKGSSIQDNLDTSKDHLVRQHDKDSAIQDKLGTVKDHIVRLDAASTKHEQQPSCHKPSPQTHIALGAPFLRMKLQSEISETDTSFMPSVTTENRALPRQETDVPVSKLSTTEIAPIPLLSSVVSHPSTSSGLPSAASANTFTSPLVPGSSAVPAIPDPPTVLAPPTLPSSPPSSSAVASPLPPPPPIRTVSVAKEITPVSVVLSAQKYEEKTASPSHQPKYERSSGPIIIPSTDQSTNPPVADSPLPPPPPVHSTDIAKEFTPVSSVLSAQKYEDKTAFPSHQSKPEQSSEATIPSTGQSTSSPDNALYENIEPIISSPSESTLGQSHIDKIGTVSTPVTISPLGAEQHKATDVRGCSSREKPISNKQQASDALVNNVAEVVPSSQTPSFSATEDLAATTCVKPKTLPANMGMGGPPLLENSKIPVDQGEQFPPPPPSVLDEKESSAQTTSTLPTSIEDTEEGGERSGYKQESVMDRIKAFEKQSSFEQVPVEQHLSTVDPVASRLKKAPTGGTLQCLQDDKPAPMPPARSSSKTKVVIKDEVTRNAKEVLPYPQPHSQHKPEPHPQPQHPQIPSINHDSSGVPGTTIVLPAKVLPAPLTGSETQRQRQQSNHQTRSRTTSTGEVVFDYLASADKRAMPADDGSVGPMPIAMPPPIVEEKDDVPDDIWCDPKRPRKIGFQDVSAAAFKIKSGIMNTPCTKSHVSTITNMDIFFKKEFNQYTGSFKERGARYTLLMLTDEQKKKGVIAASAGNHALALSYHGQDLGIPVTVVMPLVAPIMKVQACRQYGANVIVRGNDIGEGRVYALKKAKEEGLLYINGYDHPHILAGQGTMGLEIVEQVNNIDAVVIPVGGGGLIAGVALAVKSLYPNVQVIGAESERCASFSEAMKAGRPVYTKAETTLADGLAVPTVGVNAFETAKDLVDKVVTVKEEWIAIAILRLVELEKAVVEGAGATALAAVLAGQLPELAGKRVVIPLCGGNIDTTVLGRCLERGLAADGRLVKFTVTVSDRPGGIAELTRLMANLGVSIKDMLHERAWIRNDIFSVEVKVMAETRGLDHFLELKSKLEDTYEYVRFAIPSNVAKDIETLDI
ncbi:uncharacterized protein LOC143035096 [Oratosquilla oratoria]|uniref:uncharacterized protein LOC143035096 n=1 Tax=Oratosquilla oratoria TaxID=337810 RepID=UPI003F7738EC